MLAAQLTTFAQTAEAPPAAEPAATAPDEGTPTIQFEKTTYEFGRVTAGEVVRADFIFTNTGTKTLEITGVHASCGCTTAGAWDQKVEPGETGKIPLQVNTANFNGMVSKSANVTCNDPAHGSISLAISGTVWRPIEVTPNFATFNFLPGEQKKESRTVRIVNNTDEQITLSDVQNGSPAFQAELKTVEPGKVFELEIATVPEFVSTTVQAAITVKTSSTNTPLVSVTALAIMQPPPQPPVAIPPQPVAPVAQPATPPTTLTVPPHS